MDIDRVVNNLMRLTEGGAIVDDTVDWLQTDIDTIKKRNALAAKDINRKAGRKEYDEYGSTVGRSIKNHAIYGALAGGLSGAALGPVGIIGGALGGAIGAGAGGGIYRAGARAAHKWRDKSKGKKPGIFD